jgi:hypothetical protein
MITVYHFIGLGLLLFPVIYFTAQIGKKLNRLSFWYNFAGFYIAYVVVYWIIFLGCVLITLK